ncbi:MAG: DUF2087 domain-containing protein [Actinomycetes bacterium]
MAADPMTLLAALADDARLRVFARVLLHGGTTPEVAASSGLREKEALRLLTRLESVGLVAREAGGWVAHPEALRTSVAAAAPERRTVDHGVTDPDTAAVLRAFLPDGRLERIPASRSKRLVVLDHVATTFEPGVRYPEKDVNVLLSAFHPDFAALRRHLVDEGFLAREGGVYWRSGGTVEVDA